MYICRVKVVYGYGYIRHCFLVVGPTALVMSLIILSIPHLTAVLFRRLIKSIKRSR